MGVSERHACGSMELTYVTRSDDCLHRDPPTGVRGRLYIAATDHRPDPNGACGRLWSNTYILVLA